MGYGINFSTRIRDYDAARRIYDTTKPWNNSRYRGYDRSEFEGQYAKRPIEGRDKRHMTIRPCEDGSMACELYSTDVVTFHPDGKISLQPWESMSTDKFANYILAGSGLRTNFNSNPSIVWAGDRIYKASSGSRRSVTFAPTTGTREWEPVTPPDPFTRYRIDRKATREVLALYPHYSDFAAWCSGMAALKPPVLQDRPVFGRRGRYWNNPCKSLNVDWLDVIQDRACWAELIDKTDDETYQPQQWPAKVRDAIYSEHKGIVREEKLPFLNGWKELWAVKRSEALDCYA